MSVRMDVGRPSAPRRRSGLASRRWIALMNPPEMKKLSASTAIANGAATNAMRLPPRAGPPICATELLIWR